MGTAHFWAIILTYSMLWRGPKAPFRPTPGEATCGPPSLSRRPHKPPMLLWISLLCLFPITFAASEFAAPELLADYGPNTSSRPYENAWKDNDLSREPHFIRDLLVPRDTSPSTVGLQGRAPPDDLHFIPGRLIATDPLPFADGFQDRAPPDNPYLNQCSDSSYVECNGENFCCRRSTPLVLE